MYFILPDVNHTIYKYIDCVLTENTSQESDGTPNNSTIAIASENTPNSLAFYLYEIKNKIKKYEKDWDIYKKYTNPYEFINTVIPGKNRCISKYKPLSRSYFKMIEILHFFMYDDIIKKSETDHDIRTFHLAEGPGGFIEAVVNTRKNTNDTYTGMTILHDNIPNSSILCNGKGSEATSGDTKKIHKTVPGWKKSDYFLKTHKNIHIETGADTTGNILSMDNFLYCRDKYGSSMDLITGDGGFDFSMDFNNQEVNIINLLFGQVCYALCLQKKGGDFILKIFDCFMEHTVDILYILSAFYKTVFITKPKTSRYANSEKYIVCKHFMLTNDYAIFPYLKMAFQKMLGSDKTSSVAKGALKPTQSIQRFLKIPIPAYFKYKIDEYNIIFGQQQIEYICQTIGLIENITHKFEISYTKSDDNNQNKTTESVNGEMTSSAGQGSVGTQLLTQKVTSSPDEFGAARNPYSLLTTNFVDPATNDLHLPDKFPIDGIHNSSSVDQSSSESQNGQSRIEANSLPIQLMFGSVKHTKSNSQLHSDNLVSEKRSFADQCKEGRCGWRQKEYNNKIDVLIRNNYKKCIQWCVNHNISYNEFEN
jgi:23S rRNA U2552 (ribose-2'-O)-methylase RlmE/FtsJ